MRIAKKVIRFILKLLLTILIVAYILIQTFSVTILDENYVISTISQTEYYKQVYELAKSNFENYIYQSGLDESVMDDILSEEKVKEDTVTIISNIYEGKEKEISTQEIRDNLQNNIKKSTNNKEFSDSEKEAINTFIDHIVEEYETSLSYIKHDRQIYNILSKTKEYSDIAIKVLVITAIIIVIILYALRTHRKYRFITDIGVVLLATGTILTIANIYVHINVDIQNIIILNEAISKVLVTFLKSLFEILGKYGAIFGITGIVLIVIPNYIHNKNKYI